MAHAQKPDFVFRRNERVHLNRRGRQFSRLLAAEMCASAAVMLDTPCSEVPTTFASFPFTSRPVRHRVPTHFNWSLRDNRSTWTISVRYAHIMYLTYKLRFYFLFVAQWSVLDCPCTRPPSFSRLIESSLYFHAFLWYNWLTLATASSYLGRRVREMRKTTISFIVSVRLSVRME